MISNLLQLVGLRPQVYYTLTNFRGGGARPPWPTQISQFSLLTAISKENLGKINCKNEMFAILSKIDTKIEMQI